MAKPILRRFQGVPDVHRIDPPPEVLVDSACPRCGISMSAIPGAMTKNGAALICGAPHCRGGAYRKNLDLEAEKPSTPAAIGR